VSLRVSSDDQRAALRELPGLLRFGAVLLPARLVSGVTGQAGTWMVGSVGTVAATGAYSRALGLSSKLSEAGFRIIEILLPGMVERGQHDESAAVHLLVRTVRLSAVALLIVTAPGAGAASGVLAVFGDGFDRASAVLALLLGAYTLSVLTSVLAQGFLASGHPGRVTRLALLRSAITLVLLLPLAVRDGAGGVALAYVAGPAVEFLLYDRALAGHLRLGRRSLLGSRRLAGLAAAWAGAYGTSWAILRVSTSIPATVASLAAGTFVAVALVLALHLVEPEERRALAGRFSAVVGR
jgi:O-antigen/teichoic acid export membrane protein